LFGVDGLEDNSGESFFNNHVGEDVVLYEYKAKDVMTANTEVTIKNSDTDCYRCANLNATLNTDITKAMINCWIPMASRELCC